MAKEGDLLLVKFVILVIFQRIFTQNTHFFGISSSRLGKLSAKIFFHSLLDFGDIDAHTEKIIQLRNGSLSRHVKTAYSACALKRGACFVAPRDTVPEGHCEQTATTLPD